MIPVSRKEGFFGWLSTLWPRKPYKVLVSMAPGVQACSFAYSLEVARVSARVMMGFEGANAEAVISRGGVEVERVRRGA